MKGCSTFPEASALLELQSDGLVSYTGHLLEGGCLSFSAEVRSVYSVAPVDWANLKALLTCLRR